jgi:hypothetical protein
VKAKKALLVQGFFMQLRFLFKILLPFINKLAASFIQPGWPDLIHERMPVLKAMMSLLFHF